MAEFLEEFFREKRIAILIAFSALNEYEPTFGFNMFGFKSDDLACPKSR